MLIAVSVVGCSGSGDVVQAGGTASPSPSSGQTGLEEPCPDGVTLALGAPFRGRDYAKFETTGGTVYVSAGRFRTRGMPSTIYVGALARPPTYDQQAGRLRGTTVKTSVVEHTWSAIELTAGRYWLTAADGWDIVIRSCEPGGVADASTFGDS
jgi:hypothetical protein